MRAWEKSGRRQLPEFTWRFAGKVARKNAKGRLASLHSSAPAIALGILG
jgi:hypothetical protein